VDSYKLQPLITAFIIINNPFLEIIENPSLEAGDPGQLGNQEGMEAG